jgi:tripartite-type tricarboxylate transporter receptor subunit TctC
MIESGIKDYDVTLWFAYVAPAGTPDAIVAKLNGAMIEILGEPAVVDSLEKQGMQPEPGPPDAVAARIRGEIDKWRTLIAKTGLQVQ